MLQNRFLRLYVGLAAAVLAHGVWAGEAAPPGKRPTVLVLLSDDQRFDTIGALGNPEVQTPNLDRLVARGYVFRNNFVMGSTQPAVCLPSRAMLQSGRSLWRVPGNLSGVPTWGETMRRAGYAAFGAGKWHNGVESYARSFSQGGPIFFGGMCDHLSVPAFDFDPSGKYPAKNRRIFTKFSSELFADAAVDFLHHYRAAEPFFLYVAFTAPHDPRMAPEEYVRRYDPAKITLPRNFMPQHPFDNGELQIRDELLAPFPRTPEIVREHIAAYYAMITHLDAQIGRVLAALEETGHADDTVVVFSSDNGLAVGQHGLLGKQNLYEHSVRMPLLFAGPGIPRGESPALVYLYDLFPTICELAGLPAPRDIDGRSLVPLWRAEQKPVRDHVLLAYRDVQRAIRESRWKLIRYRVGGVTTTQLFDLDHDPWELDNRADDPALSSERNRLELLLERTRREFGDPAEF